MLPDFTIGLLVVIVLILVYIIVVRPRPVWGGDSKEWDCVNRATGEISSVSMKVAGAAGAAAGASTTTKTATPEQKAIAENFEHFTSCSDEPKAMPDSDCLCRGDTFEYAVHEYGGPGMGYKDWAASQSVDVAVVQNHAAFMRERTDNAQKGGIITGRTYALPDHESYQPTPWIGIRGRPSRVPVCNPTEVTDDDVHWYPSAQKLVWRSG